MASGGIRAAVDCAGNDADGNAEAGGRVTGRGKHGANVRWLPTHNAELSELLKEFSYREAADKLNAKFGTSYTRSAISGRMMRQGKGRPAIASNPADAASRKKARQERYNERRKTERHLECVVAPPREQTVMRCAEIEPYHVSIADVSGCRWPYGDGPFTFCNHTIFVRKYCKAHFFLSIGPGTSSEKAASRVTHLHLEGRR